MKPHILNTNVQNLFQEEPTNGQCCGSGMFILDLDRLFSIPDPNFFTSRIPDPNFSIPDPGSASKNLSIIKKLFLSYRKYDPGCSSRIPDPDPYFLPIQDPGSRGQKGTCSTTGKPTHLFRTKCVSLDSV
jgi:hypothetical protein